MIFIWNIRNILFFINYLYKLRKENCSCAKTQFMYWVYISYIFFYILSLFTGFKNHKSK